MIDIESAVFDAVATDLRARFSGIWVDSVYTSTPAKFPCAYLYESDNSTYAGSLDSAATEHHASLMYTAEVYSDLKSGRKAQAKSIMTALDNKMQSLGFVRVGSGPQAMTNSDTSIYRMVARYRAIVASDLKIIRR